MERRDFIRLGVLGGAAGLFVPVALARDINDSPLAGSVYFTEESPGRWRDKAAGHLPRLEWDKAGGLVQVTTGHEMKGHEHYIIGHILLDERYQFMDEHMFDPTVDAAPVSTFDLNGYRGTVWALSVCNKHGTWMSSLEV